MTLLWDHPMREIVPARLRLPLHRPHPRADLASFPRKCCEADVWRLPWQNLGYGKYDPRSLARCGPKRIGRHAPGLVHGSSRRSPVGVVRPSRGKFGASGQQIETLGRPKSASTEGSEKPRTSAQALHAPAMSASENVKMESWPRIGRRAVNAS